MNNFLSNIINIKFIRGSPDVALAKPISPHHAMQSAYHHIVPYIELATLVQQRFLYVFLDDISFFCAVEMLFLLF